MVYVCVPTEPSVKDETEEARVRVVSNGIAVEEQGERLLTGMWRRQKM